MTEIPSEPRGELTPDTIQFWLEEARLLKETADLSWRADLNAMQRVKLIYGPRHDHSMHEATEELGVELNLLYRYLISLAIQYLAIGLLIDRDPRFFLQQQPGHRIVSLLQAGGVSMTPQQLQLLQQIESAYDWAERYPVGKLGDSRDEIRPLTHQLSQRDCLSQQEKETLDALYETLQRTALQRDEAATGP